jgi:putative aminopeptidase FrvX
MRAMKVVVAALLLLALGGRGGRGAVAQSAGASAAASSTLQRIPDAEAILAPLVERYGVSGMEGPVREEVLRLLPSWAKPETDSAGNLWVRVGEGEPRVVFIAHMDEIGFRVTAIGDDGLADLEQEGGFYSSLFEGQPALVHTGGRSVPGVFAPRGPGAGLRHAPPPLRLDVGAGSRAEAEALGLRVGNTVTMPKNYQRLAGTRATGRSFDDRVGCTALLVAIRRLDPKRVHHQVIFVWSVREEIGLEGAEAVAASLGVTAARVYAVDTFVSSDSPLESKAFAYAPLGQGAVARALDNSSITPPALVDTLLLIARPRFIPLQVGTTNGGNDGSVFAPWGVPDVPLGWPLRYSHSPAEVVDLRDVVSLGDLVHAVAEGW